jgi:hypothetical protein
MKKYLSNKELYKEIIISKAIGSLTPKAKDMFYQLGKNIMRKFSYSNPDDSKDCLAEGMYQLYKNWMLFDEERSSNAFAFYTEIFKRGAAQGFNSLYKKDYLTGEYHVLNNISINGFYADGKELDI